MTSYTPSRPDLNRVRSTTITSAHVPTMTTMGAATVPPAEPPLSQVDTYFKTHTDREFAGLPVVLNPKTFPFANDQDIIQISRVVPAVIAPLATSPSAKPVNKVAPVLDGMLFKYDMDMLAKSSIDEHKKQALKLSINENSARVFGYQDTGQLHLQVVKREDFMIDFVELYFKDLYIGRSDMWRLGVAWEGKCVHTGQEIVFAGCIKAEIKNIYINKQKVPSGYFTERTKTVFRSASAKYYIAIQVCKEMYEFDEDGERYYEKAIHGFCSELFARFKELKTNHIVTIVLFSRVCYDEDEVNLVEGPLKKDPEFGWYKDFYKVCVDMEIITEPVAVIRLLKQELAVFQKAVLLDHNVKPGSKALILGALSYAHQGNVLEMINLALNPFDSHFIDRDFVRTGFCLAIISPGTGHFKVDKNLLRLTEQRITDHGLGLDILCLNQTPIHVVPLFSFLSAVPPSDEEVKGHDRFDGQQFQLEPNRPLYYDSPSITGEREELYYTVPNWIYSSFWTKSSDKRYRPGQFIPRAKMGAVQNLGVLNHDYSTIVIPYLENESLGAACYSTMRVPDEDEKARLRAAHDAYDANVFAKAAPIKDWDLDLPQTDSQSYPASTRFTSVRSPTTRNSMSSASSTSPNSSHLHFGRPPAGFSTSPLAKSYTSHDWKESMEKRDCPPSPGPMPAPGLTPSPGQSATASPAGRQSPVPVPFAKLPNTTLIPQVAHSALSAGRRDESSAPITRVMAPSVPRRVPFVPPIRTPSQTSIASKATITPTSTKAQIMPPPSLSPVKIAIGSPVPAPPPPKKATQSLFSKTISGLFGRPVSPLPPPPPTPPHAPSPTIPPVPALVPGQLAPPTTLPLPMLSLSSHVISPSQASSLIVPTRLNPTRPSSPIEVPPNHGNAPPEQASSYTSMRMRELAAGQSAEGISTSRGSDSNLVLRPPAPEKSTIVNPCLDTDQGPGETFKHQRWEQLLGNAGKTKHQIKWKSLVTPACLPITNTFLPTRRELQTYYKETAVDHSMSNFEESPLLFSPAVGQIERQAVVRELALQRLAQGFQVIVAPTAKKMQTFDENNYNASPQQPRSGRGGRKHSGRPNGIGGLPPLTSRKEIVPGGASEALKSSSGAIYMSLSSFIHIIDYKEAGDRVHVVQHKKNIYWDTKPIRYQAVIWPHLADGFSKVEATFRYPSDTLDRFNWSHLDNVVMGEGGSQLSDKITYWRARFIVIPSGENPRSDPSKELTRDEALHEGAHVLAELFEKARWVPTSQTSTELVSKPVRFLRTVLDPSACVLDNVLMDELAALQKEQKRGARTYIGKMSESELRKKLTHKVEGVPLKEVSWRFQVFPDAFTGDELVNWLIANFRDVRTREEATLWGVKFFEKGWIRHVYDKHAFMDGYYIYTFSPSFADGQIGQPRWHRFRAPPRQPSAPPPTTPAPSASSSSRRSGNKKRQVHMSQDMMVDIDPQKKSDRSEVAFLHYDAIHNSRNGFHFEFAWIGITAQLVEELRQKWSAKIAHHGLRIVEAPSEPIDTISQRSPFRACLHIPLALAPPAVEDMSVTNPGVLASTSTQDYFLTVFLREQGFVLDIESDAHFDSSIDVVYHRKVGFKHSQFVHQSGLAFVQSLSQGQGFLWADNTLFSESKRELAAHNGISIKHRREQLRASFRALCASEKALRESYARAKEARELEVSEQGSATATTTAGTTTGAATPLGAVREVPVPVLAPGEAAAGGADLSKMADGGGDRGNRPSAGRRPGAAGAAAAVDET